MRFAIGLLALSAVVGGEVYAQQKLGQPQGQRPPEAIYAKTCGFCHGTNVGPIILGRALPAAIIKQRVRHGQNAMPAFRPTEITNAELDALAKWVSASKPNPKDRGK
jgi:mono/diheme cytochrome c family protein